MIYGHDEPSLKSSNYVQRQIPDRITKVQKFGTLQFHNAGMECE